MQPLRTLMLFCAVVIFMGGATARADEKFEKTIWMGNAFDHLNRTNNVAHWSSLFIMSRVYKEVPVTEETARKSFNFFRWNAERSHKSYGSGQGYLSQFEYANASYELLKQHPDIKAKLAGTVAQYLLKKTVNSQAGDMEKRQMYNKQFYDMYASPSLDKRQILSDLYDIAKRSPGFERALDEVYGIPIFNAKISDPSQSILDNNPDFAQNEHIKRLSTRVDTLENTVKTEKSKVDGKITEVSKQIAPKRPEAQGEPKAQTETTADFVQALANMQRSKMEEDKYQFEQKGLRSGIFVIEHLMSDQTAARQFSAVANGALDLKLAVDQYNKLYQQDLDADKLATTGRTFSSVMLAFNYAAVLLTVMDAVELSAQGPSPDQIISEQIRELAKQMLAFQEENRQRFDRIDLSLSTIFAAMTAQFQTVLTKLEVASFDLQELRGAVDLVLYRLDQIERRMSEYLKLLLDYPFEDSMTRCLRHEVKHGGKLPEKEYEGCIDAIEHFIKLAKSPELSGRSAQGLTGKDFVTFLGEGDWSANVNFFLSLANERGGYHFADARANPLRWTRAADALVKLAMENEEFFRKKPQTVLKEVLEEGHLLNNTLSDQFVKAPAQYIALLGSLLTEYEREVGAVSVAAENVKTNALKKFDPPGTVAWLSHKELTEVVASLRSKFIERQILHADKWPVIETVWPAAAIPVVKEVSRGAGVSFKELKFPEYIWNAILLDSALVGAELTGLGSLQLRYFPDVDHAEPVGNGMFGVVWGEPLITIFAYLMKPAEVIPKKPIALLDYRAGWTTLVFAEPCSGGLGSIACKNLRPYPGNTGAGPTRQFDWEKFLQTQNTLALQSVIRSPVVTKQVEARLDKLLTGQLEDLIDEIKKEGSECSRAIAVLNGTVAAIRGLIALTLPGPGVYDEKLRSILYGRPEVNDCYHDDSRVEPSPRQLQAHPHFQEPLKTLTTIEGASSEQNDVPPEGVKKCSEKGATKINFEYIVDGEMIKSFLARGLGQNGKVIPKLINETILLRNLDSLAKVGSRALATTVANDLQVVSSEGNNYHPSLTYQIERLKTLQIMGMTER
jgi:hypothetical protein